MLRSSSVPDAAAYQPLAGGPEEPAPEVARASRKRRRVEDFLASESFDRPTTSGAAQLASPPNMSSALGPAPMPGPNAATTDTMWQSLLGCLSMFKDPVYATSLGCVLAASAGTGLIKSGYLMTLKGAGQEPLLANEIMDALQEIATVPAMFAAHYLIDRAAASRACHPDVPQRYMRGLAYCGAVDLALGAGLAVAALGREHGYLGNHGFLSIIALGQTIESLKALLNFGYWRCAKLNMGAARTQTLQRELQMQMIAVEMPFYLLVSYSQSIGVYALALKYASQRMMHAGAVALAAGGVLAFLPKTYFWASAWLMTRRRAAAGAASPV